MLMCPSLLPNWNGDLVWQLQFMEVLIIWNPVIQQKHLTFHDAWFPHEMMSVQMTTVKFHTDDLILTLHLCVCL